MKILEFWKKKMGGTVSGPMNKKKLYVTSLEFWKQNSETGTETGWLYFSKYIFFSQNKYTQVWNNIAKSKWWPSKRLR